MEDGIEGRRRARWIGDEAVGGRRGLDCEGDGACGTETAGAAGTWEAVRLQCPARLCIGSSSD